MEKEFTAGNLATCLHGFLGYFSAVLYDQVAPMSILPESHTPGMFSWYPAFLPLKVSKLDLAHCFPIKY